MLEASEPSTSTRVGMYQTSRGVGGGRAYESQLETALRERFALEIRNVYPDRFTGLPGKRFRQILAATRSGHWTVTIRGFVPAVALGLR